MWVHALNMDKLRVARVEFSSMCCISGAGQSTGACCGSGEQAGEILEKCQLDKFLLTQVTSTFTVQVWIVLGALLYWFLFICFSYKNRSQWHLFLEGGLMTLIWDRVYFIASNKFVWNSIKKLIIPLETFLGRLFRGFDQKKFHVYFTWQNAVAKVWRRFMMKFVY